MTIPPKKWTVLVWSASDNNLYPWQVNDLNKMERVGPSDSLNLLATIDHGPQGGTMDRIELQKDAPAIVHAQVPEQNMADPKALSDFVKWGVKNYPAEHYWLIISDHGDSWQGACEDDSAQDWMSLPKIQSALHEARQETGKKLDLVSFDCCYMAGVEVAHQLQDEARYLVASEEEMGYRGLNYEKLLPQTKDMTPRELARSLVEISGEDPQDVQTFSAIDLKRMPQVTRAFANLAGGIVKCDAGLSERIRDTEKFWEYRDAYDLADKLQGEASLAKPAREVKAAIRRAVVSERHADTHPRAHGLQIEINPEAPRKVNRGQQPSAYEQTSFAQDTGWDLAVAKLHG